jgi:hypothetical protein
VTADALLSLVLSRSDHVLWLWCFHVAVSLGLFALVVAAPAVRADRRLVRLVLFGFAFYAYTHLECMRWEVKQWAAIAAELKAMPRTPPTLRGIIDAPHPLWIIPFHVLFDAFVLYALWAATRPRPG